MKHILMDNALEAWKSAISYANDIVSGKATLKYRKNFVASLHNATELFIKQYMLDTGNHAVCKKMSFKRDPGGMLQATFNSATDLNKFFSDLSQTDAEKYRSEDYNVICEKAVDLFSAYYAVHPQEQVVVSNALTTLKDLRNNEAHFFIDKWTFLSESEFEQLYNFMIVFYKILHEYDLLPFLGEPFGEDRELDFNKQPLESFSYKDALIKSNKLKIIAKATEGMQLSCIDDSAFTISKEIVEYSAHTYWEGQFDELWAYVETAMHYGLITFYDAVVEYDDPEIGKGADFYRYINVQY